MHRVDLQARHGVWVAGPVERPGEVVDAERGEDVLAEVTVEARPRGALDDAGQEVDSWKRRMKGWRSEQNSLKKVRNSGEKSSERRWKSGEKSSESNGRTGESSTEDRWSNGESSLRSRWRDGRSSFVKKRNHPE